MTTQGMKIKGIRYNSTFNIGFTKFRHHIRFRVKDIIRILRVDNIQIYNSTEENILHKGLVYEYETISEALLYEILKESKSENAVRFKLWLDETLPFLQKIYSSYLPKLVIIESKVCIGYDWLIANKIISKSYLNAVIKRNLNPKLREAYIDELQYVDYHSLPKVTKESVEMLYPDLQKAEIKLYRAYLKDLEPQENQIINNGLTEEKTLDLMSDIVQIQNHDLRVAITQKLLA
jgi:hypothetical protein